MCRSYLPKTLFEIKVSLIRVIISNSLLVALKFQQFPNQNPIVWFNLRVAQRGLRLRPLPFCPRNALLGQCIECHLLTSLLRNLLATPWLGSLTQSNTLPERRGVPVVPPLGIGRQLLGGLASWLTISIVGRSQHDHRGKYEQCDWKGQRRVRIRDFTRTN